jgi:hypothetical protein
MLNKDQRDPLEYVYSRLEYANEQWQQSKIAENLEAFKRELIVTKDIFESLIDQGQGDEWFDKRLDGIRDTLKELNVAMKDESKVEVKPEVKAEEEASGELKNLADRELSSRLIPIAKKRKEKGFPFEWRDNKANSICTSSGYWDWKNFMVTDVVDTKFVRKLQTMGVTEENINNLESLDVKTDDEKFNNIAKTVKLWVKVTDDEFREMTGKHYSSEEIHNLFKSTFSVIFSIPYKVKKLVMGQYVEEKNAFYVHNSAIGEYGVVRHEEVNARTGVVVRRRDHYVLLNTTLGKLHVDSLLNKNFMGIDKALYDLPASSQYFYRHFLHNNNYPVMEIGLKKIIYALNIEYTSNKTAMIRYLEDQTLQPLVKHGFIDSFKMKREDSQDRIYEFRRSSKAKKLK